jgi:hypothetical protein
LVQRRRNFIEEDAEIALALAKFPGSFPNLAQHPLVQIQDEFLGQQVSLAPGSPVLRAGNIFLFSFVQFAATGDVSGVASSGSSNTSVTSDGSLIFSRAASCAVDMPCGLP